MAPPFTNQKIDLSKLEKKIDELTYMVIQANHEISKLTAEMEKTLLTPAEVCRILKIGKSTYQRYVVAEVFKQTKIGKGKNCRVYVKRSEIEKLIDEGKI